MARTERLRIVDVEFAKPHRIAAPAGAWVVCLDGTAWVTRDGCLADTILSPGDVTQVPGAEDALVVGMPRCRLGIGARREDVAGLQGTAAA